MNRKLSLKYKYLTQYVTVYHHSYLGKFVYTYIVERRQVPLHLNMYFMFSCVFTYCKESFCNYTPVRWCLHQSEPNLPLGLALFADISSPCEIPRKISFRLHERRASSLKWDLAIDYLRSRLRGLEIFHVNILKRNRKPHVKARWNSALLRVVYTCDSARCDYHPGVCNKFTTVDAARHLLMIRCGLSSTLPSVKHILQNVNRNAKNRTSTHPQG